MGSGAKMKKKELLIKRKWCKGCGICAAFCPKEALSVNNKGKVEVDNDKCSGCGICTMYCPDFVLAVKEEEGGRNVRSKAPVNAG